MAEEEEEDDVWEAGDGGGWQRALAGRECDRLRQTVYQVCV
jgi:hypothetical protein